jgi:hypothetical protein
MLKGQVSGKRTGTKFLVRTFTGLGMGAAYLVENGGSSGLYGPLSKSVLLRERAANNVGIAGDQGLSEPALNQSISEYRGDRPRQHEVLHCAGDWRRRPGRGKQAGGRICSHGVESGCVAKFWRAPAVHATQAGTQRDVSTARHTLTDNPGAAIGQLRKGIPIRMESRKQPCHAGTCRSRG